jgi:hypothetical protein
MYRNQIPLIPAEELGYHLGLTVSPEDKTLFYNVRVSETPPSAAGYGTKIHQPEHEPNKVFSQLGIPLSFEKIPATDITGSEDLVNRLREIERQDSDALLCFNHGVIRGEYKPYNGHVVVFDKIIDGKIRIIDASPDWPKWRTVDPELMYAAIKRHGEDGASGGIWKFSRKDKNDK